MRAEDVEPLTWRVVVDVRYLGAEFGTITIDVVIREDVTAIDAEELRIVPVVIGEPFEVRALDVHRHTTEKLHGLRASTPMNDHRHE